jgi:hypothetical protein
MAKKSKAAEKLAVPPTGKARLEGIEQAALAAGKRTSAANQPSPLDTIQADARRAIGPQPKTKLDLIEEQTQAIRSGQREADDAEDDNEE